MKATTPFLILVVWLPFAICIGEPQGQTKTPDCTIAITSPTLGANVGPNGMVSGTANLPSSSHLWVFVRMEGIQAWWPQANAEALIEDGKWGPVRVVYGKSGDRGHFYIRAAAVDDAANSDLMNWFKTAAANDYPPILFPNTTEGCKVAKVTVEKP